MISSGKWGDWISKAKTKASPTASRWRHGGEVTPPGCVKTIAQRRTRAAFAKSLRRDFAVLAEFAVALVTEVDELSAGRSTRSLRCFCSADFSAAAAWSGA